MSLDQILFSTTTKASMGITLSIVSLANTILSDSKPCVFILVAINCSLALTARKLIKTEMTTTTLIITHYVKLDTFTVFYIAFTLMITYFLNNSYLLLVNGYPDLLFIKLGSYLSHRVLLLILKCDSRLNVRAV